MALVYTTAGAHDLHRVVGMTLMGFYIIRDQWLSAYHDRRDADWGLARGPLPGDVQRRLLVQNVSGRAGSTDNGLSLLVSR